MREYEKVNGKCEEICGKYEGVAGIWKIRRNKQKI